MEATQVLEQVICFSLEEISLWGARKKLRAEDVPLGAGGELPPKDLASLGSKKIFNPKILAKFGTLKKQAHSACNKVGIKFMGGYAVPETKADALAVTLDAIGVKFEQAKLDFVANYEAELALWVQRHPGWESWINRATIPVAEVENKFKYGWAPAKISTPNADDPTNRLNQKMSKEAGGLAGRLFDEIADMAEKVREQSLLGKAKVNRRVLSPVRTIRSKLGGLAFLDKRVKPLIQAIDEITAQMPGDAPIEGLALSALQGLMLMMSDPERIKQFGQAVLDGNPIVESLGIAKPKQQTQVVEQEDNRAAENLFAEAAPVPAETPAVEVVVPATVAAIVPPQPAMQAISMDNLFADLDVVDAPMVRVTVKEEIPESKPATAAPMPLVAAQKLKQTPPQKRIKF